jgi:hypothetical protein
VNFILYSKTAQAYDIVQGHMEIAMAWKYTENLSQERR